MNFTETYIEGIAPSPGAFKSGKGLSSAGKWLNFQKSERAIWGEIKGSGSKAYRTQIDMMEIAYKCSCPSRQFPCKHSIGLMLLHGSNAANFLAAPETDWVKEWIDKRRNKAEKKTVVKEATPESIAAAEKEKLKRQQKRFESVQKGVDELELWLKDLVRIGFLQLPNKTQAEFEKVAARMVDAKAPGLASWVRSFSNLNFQDQDEWHDSALRISAKLFLLIQAFKNFEQLSPLWQITIKNLVGWPQSPKALLADPEIKAIKDHWIVVGQYQEESDDLIVRRTWLLGCQSNRQALILDFGTPYAPLTNLVAPGSIVEAGIAFFPSVFEYRAVIKQQRNVTDSIPLFPNQFTSWEEILDFKIGIQSKNPWQNEIICVLKQARLMDHHGKWIICDQHKRYFPVSSFINENKLLELIAIIAESAVTMVLLLKNNQYQPLGIIDGQQYIIA